MPRSSHNCNDRKYHISQEIFVIDMLRALKPSLEHDRKYVVEQLLSLVSITLQMPRPRHKKKAIIRLSSHTLP